MAGERSPGDARVLVVAPTARDATVTSEILGRAGLECCLCDGLQELVSGLAGPVGAIVLTDAALVDPGFDAVLEALARQPTWSDVPTVLLTRHREHSPHARRKLGQLTNVTLLDLPSSIRSMVSAVESAVRARSKQYGTRDQLVRQAQAEEALRQADKRKDEFLATLAHELRNPLAAIRTSLQVVVRSPEDAERSRRMVSLMDRQSLFLVKLVDDLLDVSRIATGKVALRMARIDLRAVIEAALETGQTVIEATHHDLRVEFPPTPVWVAGDLPRLAQVVSNLVNNAAKYTPDGGRILVSLDQEGDEAVVRVADNGVGIPAYMLPRVFDMFTQVNRTLDRAQGGLGIGLSLVKRLMELHGGSATADSEGLDRGSTFTLRMPMAGAEAPVELISRSLPEPGSSEGRPLKLLVIDDNADVADSLAVLLQADGHQTRTEYGGAAGLHAAEEFEPDAVFCDIGMPGVNGYEVAVRLRADPRQASTLLVALTGWGTEEHRLQTHQAGFDLHLTKPVNAEEVKTILSRY